MHLSNKGSEFIYLLEDFKAEAYQDQAGIWTIGFGETIYPTSGVRVKKGDIIKYKDAVVHFQIITDGIARKLDAWIIPNLTQNQFDACMSLAYNIGTQGFKSSTLLKIINTEGVWGVYENLFTRWNKVHIDGELVPSKGLTLRRKKEFEMFRKDLV